MYKTFEPKKERWWEKYALIPFFLAFGSVFCGMGYLIAKDVQKDMEELKQENITRYSQAEKNMR